MHRILDINAVPWRLPQRPDRGRRPGRDGFRQPGARAGRRGLPGLQPHLTRAVVLAAVSSSTRASASRRIPLHQGRWPVAGQVGRDRGRRDRPDWTMNLRAPRPRWAHKVALQGNLDPNVLFTRPTPCGPGASPCSIASARRNGPTAAGTATSSTSGMASSSTRRREHVVGRKVGGRFMPVRQAQLRQGGNQASAASPWARSRVIPKFVLAGAALGEHASATAPGGNHR